MATYEELHNLAGNNALLDRIAVAITIKADAILNDGAATTAEKAWAKTAFVDPQSQAKAFQNAVLAANSSATVAAINGATDSLLQTNVDAAVSIFAGG
jgi:hypothetical protein